MLQGLIIFIAEMEETVFEGEEAGAILAGTYKEEPSSIV